MKAVDQNIFEDAGGHRKVLLGITIYSGSTWLAELAGRVGFDTIWIEMEHGPAGFETVSSLCYAAVAGDTIPAVRVCELQRCHILRALEVGARILIVPMVNNAEQAKQIVEYGKFPPLGRRGYNTRSKGVKYGLNGASSDFATANNCTYLFAQIETIEAVENLDEILQVEGLSGVFIGPGDLSISLGATGELNSPQMATIVTDCIQKAHQAGKNAGILVGPGQLLDTALAAGCDLVFCGGDIMDLANSWSKLLPEIRSKMSDNK